jgi:hypothetical protein
MEPGFVIDRGSIESHQSTWAEGTPEPSVWTGGVKTGKRFQASITTFRCSTCGYLESYAM